MTKTLHRQDMENPNDTRMGSAYQTVIEGKSEKDLARRVAKFEGFGFVKVGSARTVEIPVEVQ
jgi:hypothetical protein